MGSSRRWWLNQAIRSCVASQLYRLPGLPCCATVDQLGFAETVDDLGERAVVTVAFAAHRQFDAGFGQTLAVANGGILRPAIAMVNQAAVH